jgi:cell division protein ZapD
MLRLEDLFFRFSRFIKSTDSPDHHAALGILFEILEVACRADLKSDLLQELERQKKALNGLHNNPEISEDALDTIITEIESASTGLLRLSGKIGQYLRDDEWLMGIKQRAVIPGGVCAVRPAVLSLLAASIDEVRQKALNAWIGPMLPLRDGISILLKLLRESGRTHHFTPRQFPAGAGRPRGECCASRSTLGLPASPRSAPTNTPSTSVLSKRHSPPRPRSTIRMSHST